MSRLTDEQLWEIYDEFIHREGETYFKAQLLALRAVADAAVAAYVPEGYALVPIEPNSLMVDAGYDAYGTGHFTPAIIDCYRAMVLAAKKEPT